MTKSTAQSVNAPENTWKAFHTAPHDHYDRSRFISEEAQEQSGRCRTIPDSATSLNHFLAALPHMPTAQESKRSNTAAGEKMKITHYCITPLTISLGIRHTRTVIIPQTKDVLISVHGLTTSGTSIVFTSKNVYMIKAKDLTKQKLHPIGTWHKGAYELLKHIRLTSTTYTDPKPKAHSTVTEQSTMSSESI